MVSSHNSEDEELFLGLVGAVGTDLGYFANVMSDQLRAYGYISEIIQLTDILPRIYPDHLDYG